MNVNAVKIIAILKWMYFREKHLPHLHHPNPEQQLPHYQDVGLLNGLMMNTVTMKITMLIANMMVERAVTTTFQV